MFLIKNNNNNNNKIENNNKNSNNDDKILIFLIFVFLIISTPEEYGSEAGEFNEKYMFGTYFYNFSFYIQEIIFKGINKLWLIIFYLQ